MILQDLDENSLILDMHAEIETLQRQVNRVHSEYSILVLEEKKWVNYEHTLAILHSKVEGLKSKRERLKKSETKLLQEVNGLRQDMVAVVAKVVPHVVSFEEVATLNDPFELEKMPSYRPLSKKEFDQAGDNIATASYPFLTGAIDDPYAPLEVLLSKKPNSLRAKPAASKSQPSYDEDVYFLRSVDMEFPAIVYNEVLTSELDLLCEPMVSPQHIDKVNSKIEISLSDFDDENYIVIYNNDSFSYKIFNVDDLKLDMGNGDDKIDIKQSSGDLSIEPLPNVTNTDVGAYVQESNKRLETSHETSSKIFKTESFIKELCVNIVTWSYLNKGMQINPLKNLYVLFGIPFDPKLFYKDRIKLGQV
ncbi:hypothetical protein Tco_0410633 [Tanacetum coccineum]